jgi:hypothetical protein
MGMTYARFPKMALIVLMVLAFAMIPETGLAQKKKKKGKKADAAEVAKPEDPTVVQAREHYSKAKSFYDAKQFTDALVEFQGAYDLKPHPSVLKSIAECQLQIGDVQGSIATFEKYLADPAAPKKPEIEARLAEINAMMASLEITSQPDGAGVMVDGSVTDKITPTTLDLAPGDHELALNMDGYEPIVKQITLAAGEKSNLEVDFSLDGVKAEEEPALIDPFGEEGDGVTVENESDGPPTAFWIAAAVAGVGLVSGTVFGTMALGDEKDYKDNPDDSIKESGERSAVIADVSFGVAAAAAIAGVVILLTNKDDEAEVSTAKSKFDIVPIATGDTVGVSTAITF